MRLPTGGHCIASTQETIGIPICTNMHHTARNVAIHQVEPASFDAGSNSVDLKQPGGAGSDMTRPTILDKTKRQIIDAVSKNRLTIVIGPAG